MATSTSTRLAALLKAGSITQEDYDTVQAEIESICRVRSDQITVRRIDRNITLSSQMPTVSELEAISKVLNTPELLEMILIQLPPHFIIARGSRICKGVQAAVNASPALQRHIFRAPDHGARAKTALFDADMKLCTSLERCRRSSWGGVLYLYRVRRDFVPMVMESATFAKTLLRQPPVRAVWLDSDDIEERVEVESGVTFGDVASAITDRSPSYLGSHLLITAVPD